MREGALHVFLKHEQVNLQRRGVTLHVIANLAAKSIPQQTHLTRLLRCALQLVFGDAMLAGG